jgi:arylsulfatase A-like enzyme
MEEHPVPPQQVSRRQFLARSALAGACATVSTAQLRASTASPSRRPNFLFLLTDDHRWDMLGCAGNPIIRTPNMDALARDGVRFANAFVTTSICAASRASVFTGLHERTHQFTFGTPPLREDLVDQSYPRLLKDAGYRTGFVGKFGVGVEKGATARMFDSFRPLNRTPYFKQQPDGSMRHETDLDGDAAVEFLGGCRPDQPFCLSISFNAPHAEDADPKQYFWPTAFDDLYKDVQMPVPKTAEPAFFERQPDFLKDSMNRERWHWRFETPEGTQEMTKGYYRMITGVDAVIGRLRDELVRLGLADNTVIVLLGDNGYFLGERGFADKWLMYEYSIRVPLLVYDPRAPQTQRGLVPQQMVLNLDVPETMLELAGLPVPTEMQGRSLVPLLRGEKPEWRTDFFYEHLFENNTIPKTEGVRTERWAYMRYFEQRPVHEELYDVVNDFDEERNLVGNQAHRDLLNTLRKRCDELRDRYGGPFVPRAKPPARAARG